LLRRIKYHIVVDSYMVKLPEHSHCLSCGDPVPFGESFCNDECKIALEKSTAAEKRKDLRFYALIAGSLIIIVLVGLTYNYLL